MTDEQKEEQRRRIQQKLEALAQATGGRTKPEDDYKAELKLIRLTGE
jgi:hypothetical protein